jgi:cytochrome c5
MFPRYRNLRTNAIVISLLCLVACDSDPSGPGQRSAGSPADLQAIIEQPDLSGGEVYAEFCASCHDSGLLGAPVTGKPADWENRSQLWQAVLTEHAKAGYLEMPARGGAGELSELSVSQAVEYMLLTTFPAQPRD